MKKYIFGTLGAMVLAGFVIYLAIVALMATRVISVGMSPIAHYKLNDEETRLIESAIADFRQKVESGKLDEIRAELAANGRGEQFQNYAIKEIEEVQENFGKPESQEFFRCLPPEPTAKYFKNINGTSYGLSYFTKAEKGEFSEHFDWVVNENKATLMDYRAGEIMAWETKNREFERYIDANYANEIKIPFGERVLEIRY